MDWKIALFLALLIGLMVAGVANIKILEKETAEEGAENTENMENQEGTQMHAFSFPLANTLSGGDINGGKTFEPDESR